MMELNYQSLYAQNLVLRRMGNYTVILPIYYSLDFKTKPSKVFLVGLNWYRNAHYLLNNKVKHKYHELTKQLIGNNKFDKIRLHYKVFAKRNGTDGHNIRSIIEKYFLDGLVSCGAIEDDSIQFVLGDSSEYFIDPDNPRIEITIIPE